jgi:hypothetical protein
LAGKRGEKTNGGLLGGIYGLTKTKDESEKATKKHEKRMFKKKQR